LFTSIEAIVPVDETTAVADAPTVTSDEEIVISF